MKESSSRMQNLMVGEETVSKKRNQELNAKDT